MPLYQYHCLTCNKNVEVTCSVKEYVPVVTCYCGGSAIRVWTQIGIVGTRDGFGIKNSFFDKKTGKVIDTWPKWEKAGFRKPEEVVPDNGDGTLHAEMKRKREKIAKYDNRKKFSVMMGGK